MSSSAGINLLRKERWLNLTFTNTFIRKYAQLYKELQICNDLKKYFFYIHICLTFRFALYVGLINSHGVLYKNVNTKSIRMLAYYKNYIILYLNIIYNLKGGKNVKVILQMKYIYKTFPSGNINQYPLIVQFS